MTYLASTHDTPAGPFTVVVDAGAVVAGGFTHDVERALGCLGAARRAEAEALGVEVVEDSGDASKAVIAWAEGDTDGFLSIPVALDGTAFQQEVWTALRTIPAGAPMTYTGLAVATGRPSAVRAAARGCATNRISLFVPCHRVVPSTGGVGGFLWGPDVKRAALAHESTSVTLLG